MMDTPPHLTVANISEIMRHLGTTSSVKISILSRLGQNTIGIYDAVDEVLSEWVGRKSNQATLQTLVDHLDKVNLRSHADAIKESFNLQTAHLNILSGLWFLEF